MSPYKVWRQESKDHKQKIIWKTSRYFSSHLVLIFILQRLISAGSGSGQHHNNTSSNPLNSFIRVSTRDNHPRITPWQLQTLIGLIQRTAEGELDSELGCVTRTQMFLVCFSTQGIMSFYNIYQIKILGVTVKSNANALSNVYRRETTTAAVKWL